MDNERIDERCNVCHGIFMCVCDYEVRPAIEYVGTPVDYKTRYEGRVAKLAKGYGVTVDELLTDACARLEAKAKDDPAFAENLLLVIWAALEEHETFILKEHA